MAAKEATSTIPIVFASTADPVGNGLIESFARPGGNITGLTDLNVELSARRLQMFLKIFPAMKRVLFVYDVNDKADKKLGGAYAKAAKALGITLLIKSVHNQQEAGKVILASRKVNVQGILGTRNTNLNINGFLLEATARRNIPTMFGSTFMVEEGGFASYGPSWHEAGRLAARLVDKIVKGENPGEIPVEVNTKLEFAINLKEANRMGLKIDPEVLYLADRIIR
jgi:putative ABC transport system substrate-binding protein